MKQSGWQSCAWVTRNTWISARSTQSSWSTRGATRRQHCCTLATKTGKNAWPFCIWDNSGFIHYLVGVGFFVDFNSSYRKTKGLHLLHWCPLKNIRFNNIQLSTNPLIARSFSESLNSNKQLGFCEVRIQVHSKIVNENLTN